MPTTRPAAECHRDSANQEQLAAFKRPWPGVAERSPPPPSRRQPRAGRRRRAAVSHARRPVARPASRHARARLHPGRPTRQVAHADIADGAEGTDAGFHPVGGLVTVLQDAARGAARSGQGIAETGAERGRDLLRPSIGAGRLRRPATHHVPAAVRYRVGHDHALRDPEHDGVQFGPAPRDSLPGDVHPRSPRRRDGAILRAELPGARLGGQHPDAPRRRASRARCVEISAPPLTILSSVTDAAVALGTNFSLVLDVRPAAGVHVYAPSVTGYTPIALSIDPRAGTARQERRLSHRPRTTTSSH